MMDVRDVLKKSFAYWPELRGFTELLGCFLQMTVEMWKRGFVYVTLELKQWVSTIGARPYN